MNIFRLAGDMTHLASVLVLLLKIHTIKSCAGISLRTQELYAIVFATRYLDIFTDFISLYNTMMKLIFLGSSFSIVWYMRRHKIVRRSYDRDQDTFRHFFIVLPCLLLALVINEKFAFKECIPSIIHSQLDLSLLHWATLCSLDNLDIWACPDIALC
uniref:Putative ER lumen protein-retaining receptor-like n=1 Tax=Davidia involucrata TaxID=16924 RepID=A0A5B7APR0_DAVIN